MRDIDKIITSYKGAAKEVKDELARDILSDGFDNEAQALEFAEEVEKIAEWLTELQERREADRWIPVTERLPDKEGKCLVFTDYGDVTMDSYRGELFICNLGNVTHWQPLPKAPESEEK